MAVIVKIADNRVVAIYGIFFNRQHAQGWIDCEFARINDTEGFDCGVHYQIWDITDPCYVLL